MASDFYNKLTDVIKSYNKITVVVNGQYFKVSTVDTSQFIGFSCDNWKSILQKYIYSTISDKVINKDNKFVPLPF